MAKKLTSEKAKEILRDKSVHGKPLTEKQKKFFGAIAGGAKPYKAQVGTMLTSLPSNWGDRLSDVLSLPQKAITKLFTGEYQTPSEAMKIQNPVGAAATDILLDPTNLLGGAGVIRSATSKAAAKAVPKIAAKTATKVAPKMAETVQKTTPVVKKAAESWKLKELPGLHLKSTMTEGPISKIVEPKTGLVNVEQALGIIGKESGGKEKVGLIKKALGDTPPQKMDFNEFRETIQKQLIPLERQVVNYRSDYGLNRLGYNTPVRGGFGNRYVIKEAEAPLENQTLLLSNKSGFGKGSSAHDNPDETLGHIHFLRSADSPDALTVTQIQSDAFQGTHRSMPKSKEEAMFSLGRQEEHAKALEDLYSKAKPRVGNDGTVALDFMGRPIWYELPNGQVVTREIFEETPSAQRKINELRRIEIENFEQKSLLDKSHQERYLQEIMSYAGERGMNKLRLPTSETAAKIQGYRPVGTADEFLQNYGNKKGTPEWDEMMRNTPGADKVRVEKILKGDIKGDIYDLEHETILKKYREQPKNIKKLFGVEPKTITDNKGNTWYELDIPKSFKGGKGEIRAFEQGGWLDKYEQGGMVLKQKTTDNYGTKPNANNSDVSLPPGFKGWAYNTKGRNYSPAWGGQFAMGGNLPGATGMMYARTINPAPSNGPYAKKTKASAQDGEKVAKEWLKNWYEERKTLPEFENIASKRIEALEKVPAVQLEPAPEMRKRGMLAAYIPAKQSIIAADPSTMMEGYDPELGVSPYVLGHEMIHALDYMAPQSGRDVPSYPKVDFVSEKASGMSRPEYSWITSGAFPGTKTEVNAVLYGLRQAEGLKGNQPTTPNQMKSIIDKYKNLGEKELNPRTKEGTMNLQIKNLLDVMGNDPEKLSELNNRIVKGKGKAATTAQNGQEMKYYQEGLDFKPKTISQNGSRTPIVVTDPNDPRLKDYHDSLSLYNRSIADKNRYLKFINSLGMDQSKIAPTTPYYGVDYEGNNRPLTKSSVNFVGIDDKGNTLYYGKNKPDGGGQHKQVANAYMVRPGEDRRWMKINEGVWVDHDKGKKIGKGYLTYKKPVQPVILEEQPRLEKPIPIPRDTRDLGYTLPTPGQFTAPELYKYNPDTPTKFSFTYPTGGYNEQKTIYFPTRSAWKSYVEGIKGTEKFKGSQEGVDYAQATGYLQDGGDIPVDPMGYWNPENVGEPVIIPSNVITMEGVDQPLLGISDTGDVQYMEPGEDYEFDGEYVTEYPMAKGGVSVNNADAQPLKKLDQLFNFTNYNKPTKGGWLDKYN